ncbi:4'-phosphopantetheinyl transferase superfamily protein [Clostridium sp. MSJ-8]|uniref:4'-phosphopantetheinyl transferase family protein n=1 Tax=Clostridium sp. MSJ-8 TaxID=2841510 RepID=UPI001C0F1CAE|nr:4'-phosphopantetheinyl transferase superfamily protein [Clostridium sp. MSJ-8]MBU5488602.1 4'-phosphopantetheinyl transferase superfamily protein [Clostridium sp. MSJ-8]
MIKLLAANINQDIEDNKIEEFLKLISKEKLDKINRYRFREDYLRSLYGDILVRFEIIKQLGIANSDIKFTLNKYGKPYIEGYNNLFFNISHSEDWVICAISDEEVGVDIEKIEKAPVEVAEHYFHSREYKLIRSKASEEVDEYFYKMWTLKESYIKWIGKGLSKQLDSFSINEDINNEFYIEENKELRLNQCKFDKDYIISLCSKEVWDTNITVINMINVNIK